MAFNSLVIQDLTYTQAGYSLVALKVTYVNASALEVVSFDGTTLTVNIIAGTSTATAIAAAVNASTLCNPYLVCTVSGTGATAQKSCVSATLSGGLAAAKASLTVGGVLVLTAESTGTAGNSVRFKFTSGAVAGSEVVTVSTNDVSVQIAEGVSTYQQVYAALHADSAVEALVDLSGAGPAWSNVARVAHMPAFVALSGGVAATAPSVTVQDIKVASKTTGTSKNGKTVTYTTGATAGSEVVSLATENMTVQIENSVSTATQIKAAIEASVPADALYTITIPGTGATAQKTVNALALAGATPVQRGVYKDGTSMALTSSYVAVRLGSAVQLDLINDETSGVKGINYSWDGTNQAGSLLFGQTLQIRQLFSTSVPSVIYLKYISSAPAYRLSTTPQ